MLNNFFLSKNFFRKKFNYINVDKFRIFILFKRSSIITDIFLNKIFRVYSGSKFVQFIIEDRHIGKKFGEFSFTKKMGINIHLRSGRNLKVKSKIKVVKKK